MAASSSELVWFVRANSCSKYGDLGRSDGNLASAPVADKRVENLKGPTLFVEKPLVTRILYEWC